VLFELLSGARAFTGEDVTDSLVSVLTKEPDWTLLPTATPPRIVDLVRRCLKKDPHERLRDIGDARIDTLPTILAAPPASSPAPRKRGRALAAVTALMVAGIAAGILIQRARERGRPGEPPLYQRLTFDRGTVDEARFAPDGHTIVYSAAWRGEPNEIYTTRLGSRESRAFGIQGLLHSISSTGELAVDLAPAGRWRAGNIARVPMGGGAPREVLDRVTWADWMPDGADLAVVRVWDYGQRIEFPIGNVVYETTDNITHLRVSPRGDWLAFVQHTPESPRSAGSLLAVSRSGAKQALSSNWADLFGVAWSPEGREVWFTAAKRGEFKAIRAVSLDGKERLVARLLGQVDLQDIGSDGRVLLTQPTFRIEMMALGPGASRERDLTWLGLSALADLSISGRQVLFTEQPEGGGEGGQTYLRQTDGAPAVRLGGGVALALSPDGKWALSQLASPARLVLLPTGIGTAKTLKGTALTYRGWGSWFPDSRRIFFMAQAKNGPPRAYMQDTNDGDPVQIGPLGIRNPTVAPDGRTVAALTERGPVLFTIGVDDLQPCRGLDALDVPIGWSSDGRALFFTRARGSTVEIHRLEVSSGRERLLWSLAHQDAAGALIPGGGPGGGIRLTPDGKYYAYSFIRSLSDLYLVEGLK
jgi:Tol biopolymer transport system component